MSELRKQVYPWGLTRPSEELRKNQRFIADYPRKRARDHLDRAIADQEHLSGLEEAHERIAFINAVIATSNGRYSAAHAQGLIWPERMPDERIINILKKARDEICNLPDQDIVNLNENTELDDKSGHLHSLKSEETNPVRHDSPSGSVDKKSKPRTKRITEESGLIAAIPHGNINKSKEVKLVVSSPDDQREPATFGADFQAAALALSQNGTNAVVSDETEASPEMPASVEVAPSEASLPVALVRMAISISMQADIQNALGLDHLDDADMGQTYTGVARRLLPSVDVVPELFTPQQEAELASMRDTSRWPVGYDPTWADHWPEDPKAMMPEMFKEFLHHGLNVDKSIEQMSAFEAKPWLGLIIFPAPYDYNPDMPEISKQNFYTQERDVTQMKWDIALQNHQGDYVKRAISKKEQIEKLRLEEKFRQYLWQFVINRRNRIKHLMDRLALGELSFSAASGEPFDLEKSVLWQVFKNGDFDQMLALSPREIEMLTTRMLDKLPWPPGLSRLELLDRFDPGRDPSANLNLSPYGRPPTWLLPDKMWMYGSEYVRGATDISVAARQEERTPSHPLRPWAPVAEPGRSR